MRNTKKLAALTLALSFSFLGATSFSGQTTSYASSMTSTPAQLGVDTGKGVYKESTISLRQNEDLKKEVLNEVRDIRSKLWDENILYTLGNSNSKTERIQDVAKANGYTTKQAYVNGLKWSNDLEKIAIQRAYEQLYTDLSHERPDGRSFDTAKVNGIYPNGEIVASSTAQESPAKAFNQWSFLPSKYLDNKSEYQMLKEAKGVSDANNGHLHSILNPEFKYIGFSEMNNPNGKWNYAAGEFARKIANNNENSVNLTGSKTLYIGDASNLQTNGSKKETGKSKISPEDLERLKKSVEDAKIQLRAVDFLFEKTPNFAKTNGKYLNQLATEARELIKRAEAILAKY
ncbi:CAP domain-containing protein [uncultured Anaerococcus sp.]|uniref:CAP domain-containing protein n=1 Tax=uncultured Anaerococcus sp. TaxID=293428 RepID=UPI002636B063|nr:CAP domain-containing protein [uncultured Anaerococcus sp.]